MTDPVLVHFRIFIGKVTLPPLAPWNNSFGRMSWNLIHFLFHGMSQTVPEKEFFLFLVYKT
jgi:hypothetical protein